MFIRWRSRSFVSVFVSWCIRSFFMSIRCCARLLTGVFAGMFPPQRFRSLLFSLMRWFIRMYLCTVADWLRNAHRPWITWALLDVA